VLKTQGRRGEVGVETYGSVPDRFREGMRLFAVMNANRRELKIEEIWPQKGHLVFKFAGVDSISDAESLIGYELQVPRSERAQLQEGWTYVSDLIGCTVFDGDKEIGTIDDVQSGTGEAPLLIVKAGEKEYEIPFAEAYLKRVDIERKRIEMSLPEGMLDVNEPLTAEEKQQQKSSQESAVRSQKKH
jgi:16S rRNA processing protein RimM